MAKKYILLHIEAREKEGKAIILPIKKIIGVSQLVSCCSLIELKKPIDILLQRNTVTVLEKTEDIYKMLQ